MAAATKPRKHPEQLYLRMHKRSVKHVEKQSALKTTRAKLTSLGRYWPMWCAPFACRVTLSAVSAVLSISLALLRCSHVPPSITPPVASASSTVSLLCSTAVNKKRREQARPPFDFQHVNQRMPHETKHVSAHNLHYIVQRHSKVVVLLSVLSSFLRMSVQAIPRAYIRWNSCHFDAIFQGQ